VAEHDGTSKISWSGRFCKLKETFGFPTSPGLLSRHLQHFSTNSAISCDLLTTVKQKQRSLLLHRALRRDTLIIPNQCTHIKFHIKTLKIAPTCFDHKIVITCDFSKEQHGSLMMILWSKHVGAILSVLIWNFIWVHWFGIIKVKANILQP